LESRRERKGVHTCCLELEDVGFEAGGEVETLEETRVGELDLVAVAVAFVIGWRWGCGEGEDMCHVGDALTVAAVSFKNVCVISE
jgi:hypothetical protein